MGYEVSGTLDVLRQLTGRFAQSHRLEDRHAAIARAALEVTGAARAALLLHVGEDRFAVVAAAGEPALPPELELDDLGSPLWKVADGGPALTWTPADAPPILRGSPAWSQGIAVAFPAAAAVRGLLVVADERDLRAHADALELVAIVGAQGVVESGLETELADAARMLAGAREVARALALPTDPQTMRRRVLDALVRDAGFLAAALWAPDGASGGAVLEHAAGLDAAERMAWETLPAASAVAELLQGGENQAALVELADTDPAQLLRLASVPTPLGEVLGVFVPSYADPHLPVQAFVDTLARDLAAALQRAAEVESSRRLLDTLRAGLRPRALLPSVVAVGDWHRSGAAGLRGFGGDFLDWFVTARDHVGIAIGDVAGRGVEAASRSTMAVWALRAFGQPGGTPQLVMAMLDRFVAEQTPAEVFITMAYARLDLATWRAGIVLAGHPPPALVRPSSDLACMLDVPADVPLGVQPGAVFTTHELTLQPGDNLVLYTDGVTEARSADGSLFGPDRLQATLQTLVGAPPQQLAAGIGAAVEEWTGREAGDDAAVLVLGRVLSWPDAGGGRDRAAWAMGLPAGAAGGAPVPASVPEDPVEPAPERQA